jgi:hypothetical protein
LLTDAKVRAAKPRSKTYKLADANSLFLMVTPSGGNFWHWKHHYCGGCKSMAFGAWPHVPLADARAKRDEAYNILCEGRDPAVVKKLRIEANLEAGRRTFKRVAREWHENAKLQWAAIHARDVIPSLERVVFPVIGSLPIAEMAPMSSVASSILYLPAEGANFVANCGCNAD